MIDVEDAMWTGEWFYAIACVMCDNVCNVRLGASTCVRGSANGKFLDVANPNL